MIKNKKLLIYGGTGSLGHAFVTRYIKDNIIVNYSRNEANQWEMGLLFNTPNLRFIIGDIRDYSRVESSLIRENPHIVVIAAALKHIDKCELEVRETFLTNFMGPLNVTDAIEKNRSVLTNLETVVFVSTDKSVSSINTYGCTKFLSERMMVEKAFYVPSIKFVTIRYGNVLNSRGSIIPMLHKIGQNPEISAFTLTDKNMTRFVMTLNESIDLIHYAIVEGESGDVIVPSHLISMRLEDLLELFSEKYNKPIKVTGLRPGEKLLESLINDTQSMSMIKMNDHYHIKPFYKGICNVDQAQDYNSRLNPLTKEQLKEYLIKLDLY
jgi:UDP-N-acetylglucosamine 4,6-dehydratase/5-epimerase